MIIEIEDKDFAKLIVQALLDVEGDQFVSGDDDTSEFLLDGWWNFIKVAQKLKELLREVHSDV